MAAQQDESEITFAEILAEEVERQEVAARARQEADRCPCGGDDKEPDRHL